MQDTYRIVIDTSKHLEALLEARGATGRGLHEKLSSIEDNIAPEIQRAIRFVATIRNRVIHEHGYELSDADLRGFQDAAHRAVTALGEDRAESAETQADDDGPNPWLDGTVDGWSPKLTLKNVAIGIAAVVGFAIAPLMLLAVFALVYMAAGASSRGDEDDIFTSRPQYNWDSEDLVDECGTPMPRKSPWAR